MTRGEAVNWLINIMADIGKAEHSELWHYEQALSEIREILESEPQRKTGKWIKNSNGTYSCDKCHSWIPNEQHYYANFCLYCGADMRGEEL